ncbi:type II toxin-antitoxin system VapB family antitoxin [uncultured Brevundimonas sp.]|uniref:type II toxin-antitoxin system VapB family antitoxin n=1 Tax=uncultured Brevundimonas sp. TaxID=213418 RepID=UPI0030EE3982|tara:strand:+ start:637 stop:876 length:240 start_codon:yes stop_codon:yes gene_type:complete
MAFHVRDAETDALVRALARQRGVGLTEAVRLAVQAELEQGEAGLQDKLRRMQGVSETVARWEPTGLTADKAFFDAESGD